ncbi:MAG: VCBS repeat-containing protein [Williamsia herbipolensis]|nr:VCBS repeat-containing protein [Williamsia herbipolensis]
MAIRSRSARRTVVAGVLAAALTGATLLPPAAGAAAPQSTPVPQSTVAPPATPDDVPAGADDGLPVGDPASPVDRVQVSPGIPDQPAASSSATRRWFGSHPWTAIRNAAVAATKCSGLSADELRAMAVAPIFKESGGGTTAASAPSPMTLSRYDEWSGVRNGSTNSNANYGLYAFRDPSTGYKRAYWTPGIGIWQYDSAGVGAPFTAAERMDVGVISVDVVSGMRDRWCSPGQWISGGAPYTEAERRAAAWAPWWYTDNGGCPLCEQAYQDMAPGTSAAFANISTVAMDPAGGAQRRTCRLSGVAGTVTCWYVDPRRAQGASWWASLTPLDGGSPTEAPAPLSAPFYDVKIGGQERRYWLQADTGYNVDISGTRTLGKNARPKTNQAGSGVTWSAGGVLCDVTGRRGSCDPSIPPAGVTSTRLRVDQTDATVLSLDANRDGRGDLLIYDSRTGTAQLRTATTAPAGFTSRTLTLLPSARVVIADVDGDGADDIVSYRPDKEQVQIQRPRLGGAPLLLRMGGHRILFAVDGTGTGRDQLFFYGPGSISDVIWTWTGRGFATSLRPLTPTFQPLVGDFDGDGLQDILFYGAGRSVDVIHFAERGGRFTAISLRVDGTYRPVVGDLDGDGRDDVVWYGPGGLQDSVWFGSASRRFTSAPLSMGGDYRPFVVDLPADGRDDVVWFGPGSASDRWTRWSAARASSTTVADLGGTQVPVVGAFGARGRDGIFWYGSRAASDWLWR